MKPAYFINFFTACFGTISGAILGPLLDILRLRQVRLEMKTTRQRKNISYRFLDASVSTNLFCEKEQQSMKKQLQSRKPNFKRKPYQKAHVAFDLEQTVSTSISSDWAWIWLSLVLVVVVAGLYWLNDQREDQADWSYETVDNDLSTAESRTETEMDDQGAIGLEMQTNPLPEDLNPPGDATDSQNEQLVRRYYDEVLSQRQLDVMNDLFAEEFTYQRNDVTSPRQNLAALKRQVWAENAVYDGLMYTIEGLVVEENWVIVNWSAAGQPVNAPLSDAPQRWSGLTGWQIVDGKIIWMLIYDAASQRNGLDEDEFWQSDPFQNNRRLNE